MQKMQGTGVWSLGGEDPWVGKIPWRRAWQSTPVLLPGKSYGERSLVGSSPWGGQESDPTEADLAHTHGFSSSHVQTWWELDHKDSRRPKNWCFWIVVLETTLESPLDCKEIQPVHPKGNQSWIFIGRTGVEAKAPILWPPDAKSWLIGKDPDAGKDWGQEEKGMTEDEMVGWQH